MSLNEALQNICGDPEGISMESIKTVAAALNSPARNDSAAIENIQIKFNLCHPHPFAIQGLLLYLSDDAKKALKQILGPM